MVPNQPSERRLLRIAVVDPWHVAGGFPVAQYVETSSTSMGSYSRQGVVPSCARLT
jgi:hypothetical protein